MNNILKEPITSKTMLPPNVVEAIIIEYFQKKNHEVISAKCSTSITTVGNYQAERQKSVFHGVEVVISNKIL